MPTTYRRHRTDASSAYGNAVFKKKQEQVLVGVAPEFSINNPPLSRPQLRELVNSLFGTAVSREWVDLWLAGHRFHLSLRA